MTDNNKKQRPRTRKKRTPAGARGDDDVNIETITYADYLNADIPDVLLQGLGFAESLSSEPVESKEDSGEEEAQPAEIDVPLLTANVLPLPVVSNLQLPSLYPQPLPAALTVPVSLLQLLSSPSLAAGLISNCKPPTLCQPVASRSKIVSETPSAVSLVDADGKILMSVPPPAPIPVGNAVSSSVPGATGKTEPCAVTLVDRDGRVISSPASSGLRLVDSDGRVVTTQVSSVDQNGRVGSSLTASSYIGARRLARNCAPVISDVDAGTFQPASTFRGVRDTETSPPSSSSSVIGSISQKTVSPGGVKGTDVTVDVSPSSKLVKTAAERGRVKSTSSGVGRGSAGSGTKTIASTRGRQRGGIMATVTSRTKGRVRYDRLPTGEVVASIVRDDEVASGVDVAPVTTTNNQSAGSAPVDTVGGRGQSAGGRGQPVSGRGQVMNESNVTEVVEEAHRATQSMRILLTSMRDELRRAGGLGTDGRHWTPNQLRQRLTIAHRLAGAYQSYRSSISDIENLRFRRRAGNSTNGGSSVGNSSAREVVVDLTESCSSDHTENTQTPRKRRRGNDSEQVIDLTL